MAINFERLVSRNVARFVSDELDLSGLKTSVNNFIGMAILGSFLIFISCAALVDLYLHLNIGISLVAGIGGAGAFIFVLYSILEYNIERRKTFVESILPDYIQLAAANMRSGVSIDKAMVAAARPEFGYFSRDIMLMDKQIYAGENMQNALIRLAGRYRSRQLEHMVKMLNESARHGGGMQDLLREMGKDLRNQLTLQKEISGQLFLYTIFITFAILIGAPALFALTNNMIKITTTIWGGILAANPNGFPSTGVAFLRPVPPKITAQQYFDFSLVSVIVIAVLGSLIIATISTGAPLKGLKYIPVFLAVGLSIFYIGNVVVGGIFSSLGAI